MRIGIGHGALQPLCTAGEGAGLTLGRRHLHHARLETFVDPAIERVAQHGDAVLALRLVPRGHVLAFQRPTANGPGVVFEGIVLGTQIVGAAGEDLRMGHEYVVGLHKRFLHHLPVGANDLGDVRLLVAPLVREQREMASQIAKMFGQRGTRRVRIEKNESPPPVEANFRERFLGAVQPRKVIRTRNLLQLSVQRPRPAVERAAQLRQAPGAPLPELATAVQARVVVGLVTHLRLRER